MAGKAAETKTYVAKDPVSGTKYTIHHQEGTKEYTVADIDVPDGVDKVIFNIERLDVPGVQDASGIKEFVEIEGHDRGFPDVKALVLGQDVKEVLLPNSLFPNVRKVISKTRAFVDHKPYLAWQEADGDGGMDRTLLNAFCLQDGEKLDLYGIKSIDEGALYGCGAIKVKNTNGVACCNEEIPEEILEKYAGDDGICVVGTILAEVSPGFEEITIRSGLTCVAKGAFEGAQLKTLNVEKQETPVFREILKGIPHTVETLRANPKNATQLKILEIAAKEPWDQVKDVGILGYSHKYKSVDGAIYSRDGKKALFCPMFKEGHVDIPEGVEEIRDHAFDDTYISSVTLPQSLKEIGEFAFAANELTEISIPASVEKIGESALAHPREIYIQGNKPIPGLLMATSSLNTDGWFTMEEDDEDDKYDYACTAIHFRGTSFAIPNCLDPAGAEGFIRQWESGVFNQGLSKTLFLMAPETFRQYETAILALKLDPGNDAAALFLKDNAADIMHGYIKDSRIDKLAEFLKMDIADGESLRAAFDEARQAENKEAAAYILNALNGKAAPDFGIGTENKEK